MNSHSAGTVFCGVQADSHEKYHSKKYSRLFHGGESHFYVGLLKYTCENS